MKKTYIVDKSNGDKYPVELCSFFGETLEKADVRYDSQDEWNDIKIFKSGKWKYLEEDVELTSDLSIEEYDNKVEEYNNSRSNITQETQEEVEKVLGKEPKFDFTNTTVPDWDEDYDLRESYEDIRDTFKTDKPDFEGIKQFGINPDEFLQYTINLLNYRKESRKLYGELSEIKFNELNNIWKP